MALYAIERSDDQSVMGARLSILAAAIALLSALAFALLRDPATTPGWLFALLPLPPLPLIGLTATYLVSGEHRSVQLDLMEHRLRELSGVMLGGLVLPSTHTDTALLWRTPIRTILFALSIFAPLVGLYLTVCILGAKRASEAGSALLGIGLAFSCVAVTLGLLGVLATATPAAKRPHL